MPFRSLHEEKEFSQLDGGVNFGRRFPSWRVNVARFSTHQRYSDGCWCAILMGKWNHRRSSAPTPIWIQPTSSRTSQSDGKWRSLFRRCAPTSELKPHANGPGKRSREPHQHCSVSTVWFVSGRSGHWSQIGCHMPQRGMKRPTLHSPMQLLRNGQPSIEHWTEQKLFSVGSGSQR